MPVQKMKPIRSTSIAATLAHMAQVVDGLIDADRRERIVEAGIKTYNGEIAKDLIKHYSTDGGTPLRWVGSGCAHFGVDGQALTTVDDTIAMQRIFLDGVHPTATDENGEPIKLRQRQRSDAVAAYGFIHADPKTQGLVRLYESQALQDRLASIHDRTNTYFLDFLESCALDVSITLKPNETYRCLGLIAIQATHHTSSKADPHPHDHMVIANMTPVEITTTNPDGMTSVRIEYRTLDSRLLDRMRFAAGEAATQYQRHLIETELGLQTMLNGDIIALADADLIKEFSKARQHILKLAQEQDGETAGAKSDELLWLMTRRGNASADIERAFDAAWNDPEGRVQVLALWRAAVANAGNGWLEQIDIVGQFALENIENNPEFAGPKPAPELTPERRAEIVTQVVEALDDRAVFSREWVFGQAIHFGEGYWPATEEEIGGELVKSLGLTEELVEEILADRRIVQLQPKKNTNSFSTAATLDIQARMLIALDKLSESEVLDDDPIPYLKAAQLKAQESQQGIVWDEEQRAAFDAAFSNTGLVNWLGVAGSGKSTLVNAVYGCYEGSATPIFGCAVTGAAVERLRQAAPGLRCDTVASLVMRLDRGEALPRGIRVIIDEDYQVSLVDADLITRAVLDARGQIIALGDPRQAQAIDGRGAGSLIAHAARKHGNLVELNHVYRIKSEKINALAAAARVRNASAFLQVVIELAEAKKVAEAAQVQTAVTVDAELTVTKAKRIEDEFDAIAEDLGQQWKSSKEAPSAIAIAYLNDDASELARRVQAVRWGHQMESGEDVAKLESRGQFACVGDQVRTRSPIKSIGVFNGREWRVDEVDSSGAVALSSGETHVKLGADYVRDHLELAYASTGHSAQGGGWKNVYGIFRGDETSTWAYEVITRAEDQLHLYAEIPTGTGDITHFWKAILQRDDEQVAALLQAEEAVRERVTADAKGVQAEAVAVAVADIAATMHDGASGQQVPEEIHPEPSVEEGNALTEPIRADEAIDRLFNSIPRKEAPSNSVGTDSSPDADVKDSRVRDVADQIESEALSGSTSAEESEREAKLQAMREWRAKFRRRDVAELESREQVIADAKGEQAEAVADIAATMHDGASTTSPQPMTVAETREWRGSRRRHVVAAPVKPQRVEPEISHETGEARAKEYHGGFFYRDNDGVWTVDEDKRFRDRRSWRLENPGKSETAFKIDKQREIEPGSGEFYHPDLDKAMVARRDAEEAERIAYFESHRNSRGPSYSTGGGKGGGKGESRDAGTKIRETRKNENFKTFFRG